MTALPVTPDESGPKIGILGPGAVGRSLALNLTAAGYRVATLVARRFDAAESLARDLPSAVASDRIGDLPGGMDWVFCTVSDDALPEVAKRLSTQGEAWRGRIVAHTSGLRSSDVFEPLKRLGAEALSFHPAQAFPPGGPMVSFRGVFVGIEGTPRALELGKALASRMGAIPMELQPRTKALYHLAAVAASNYFVTLLACVYETLHAAGIDPELGRSFVEPLVESTWKNVFRSGPESALTGPIVRGEHGTVLAHLDAISSHVPHLGPFYGALSAETIRLAVRSGRLPVDQAEMLLDTLHRWLVDWSDDRTSSR